MATLYLNLDGVLADFDRSAGQILKTDNIYKFEFVHGPDEFWRRINAVPRFFQQLQQMPDAGVLWASVRHLSPHILTALPKTDPDRVDRQKRAWVSVNFGSGVQVTTCPTKDKPRYCSPGDILVDDRAVNREAWKAQGGTFLLHTSARDTVAALKALGVID